MSAKLLIILGTVRPGRMSERVAITVKKIFTEQGLEPTVLDPLELPFEVIREPLTFMPDPSKAPEWMLETKKKIEDADGYVFVTAEYNCSVPPPLSNLLDHFHPDSFRHKPGGIVTYSIGPFGGVRAPVALRPILTELGMVGVPYGVSIPFVQDVFDEDGKCNSERFQTNIGKLVKEVLWYAEALKTQKTKWDYPVYALGENK